MQAWPSDLAGGRTLLESSLPDWLVDPAIERLLSIPVATACSEHIFQDSPHQTPNHVLINEYLPGQGIMPHVDGGAYHPVVCTISLGSSLCLDIHERTEEGSTKTVPTWRILQEPRSLLITTHDLYTQYLHGIAPIERDVELNQNTIANWNLLRSQPDPESSTDRQIRVSLTYRDVIKVSKLGRQLGVIGRR